MRVLISALRFSVGRTLGGEVYFKSILKALNQVKNHTQIAIAASPDVCRWVEDIAPDLEALPANVPNSTVGRVIYESIKAQSLADSWSADVIFFPFNMMPKMRLPSVLFIHDLVNNFYCSNFPHCRPIYNRTLRYLVGQSILKADIIVTPSQSIASEIKYFKKEAQNKIIVPIYETAKFPNADMVRPSRLPDDGLSILLQVGDHMLHKSHKTGIEAMGELKRLYPDVFSKLRLVLTGGIHSDESLPTLINRLDISSNVTILGKVPTAELEWLMKHATIMVFPTLYEGFGLGILEAQLRGKAVIASDIPVLREVSGGLAVFFEPANPLSLANSIYHLYCNEAERLSLERSGNERANNWTWEEHARDLLEVFEKARQKNNFFVK